MMSENALNCIVFVTRFIVFRYAPGTRLILFSCNTQKKREKKLRARLLVYSIARAALGRPQGGPRAAPRRPHPRASEFKQPPCEANWTRKKFSANKQSNTNSQSSANSQSNANSQSKANSQANVFRICLYQNYISYKETGALEKVCGEGVAPPRQKHATLTIHFETIVNCFEWGWLFFVTRRGLAWFCFLVTFILIKNMETRCFLFTVFVSRYAPGARLILLSCNTQVAKTIVFHRIWNNFLTRFMTFRYAPGTHLISFLVTHRRSARGE